MTCDKVQDLMLPFVAETLDAEEEQAVRDHLACGCPTCYTTLAHALTLVSLLPLALPPTPPPALAKQSLMEKVRAATA